ncbi:MAG: XRE family transcriptional regulator [Patescibacteria group bacterium]
MLININPKILIWAREERFGDMSLDDVSSKLGIATANLAQWEKDGLEVPFEKLALIAKIYKRQTAIFFLLDVPPKTKKIKDYRNFALVNKKFYPDALLAIRRTERYLKVARELEDVSTWKQRYQWLKDFNGRKENIKKESTYLRKLLIENSDIQIGKGRSDEAFRYWRSKIEEKLNVFVFQFSMPDTELDGFSYAFDVFPYAIVLNNRKKSVRKIFTLFHELAHILKHNPGACNQDFSLMEDHSNMELECNSFAGEFLVPSQSIKIANTVDEIFNFAKSFNISGEVYLRRMLEEQKIDKVCFFRLLDEVRVRSNSLPKKQNKGPRSMIVQSKSTRGNKFFSLITNAATMNKISFSSASDLLGLKASNIRL